MNCMDKEFMTFYFEDFFFYVTSRVRDTKNDRLNVRD